MDDSITVRGRLVGARRIDLDEPVCDVVGEVEIILRAVEPSALTTQSVFDFIRSLPPGTRTKEEIDRQIADERDAWGVTFFQLYATR